MTFFSFSIVAISLLIMISNVHAFNADAPDLIIDEDELKENLALHSNFVVNSECYANQEHPCVGSQTIGDERALLRFDLTIINNGTADFFVGLVPQQAFSHSNNTEDHMFPNDKCFWQRGVCHTSFNHWHVQHFARYGIWTVNQTTLEPIAAITNSTVIHGLCLKDSKRVFGSSDQKNYTCDGVQGITSGWASQYDKSETCQWVDITDLNLENDAETVYALVVDIGCEVCLTPNSTENNAIGLCLNLCQEENIENNRASAPFILSDVKRFVSLRNVVVPLSIIGALILCAACLPFLQKMMVPYHCDMKRCKKCGCVKKKCTCAQTKYHKNL